MLGVDTAAVSLLGGDGCFVQDARGRTHATQACWAGTLAGWPLLQPTDAHGLVTELSVSGKRCALWRSRLRSYLSGGGLCRLFGAAAHRRSWLLAEVCVAGKQCACCACG